MTQAEHIISDRGFARTVEAAKFLGITRQAVSKLVKEQKIPARRFGRSLRIPWTWLIAQERCDELPKA
jgi:excisionase family DNA binding protein